MTAQEIRQTPIQAGTPQSMLLLVLLREIAAQLAEIAENMKGTK